MSKNIKRNTRALQTTYDNYKNRLTQAVRTKLQNLINFDEDRKIAQFTTADNLMRQFITANADKRQKQTMHTTKSTTKNHSGNECGKQKKKTKNEILLTPTQ